MLYDLFSVKSPNIKFVEFMQVEDPTGCHAGRQKVCRCRTRGESEKSTLALKLGVEVTRSPKQGYKWPHKKDSCPPKIKIKKFIEFIEFNDIRTKSRLSDVLKLGLSLATENIGRSDANEAFSIDNF